MTAVVILSLCCLAQHPPQFYVKDSQIAHIEGVKLVTAAQKCENWSLAAGLEAMLKQQDVSLDQRFWVTRINGGEVCASELPSSDQLIRAVNGDFVLDDGRHVLLDLHYLPGAPANADGLIAALKQQKLSLLLLHDHVYYLTGATYNDYYDQSGKHLFVITELHLSDTFANQPEVIFNRDHDNLDEIGAIISVTATPADAHR